MLAFFTCPHAHALLHSRPLSLVQTLTSLTSDSAAKVVADSKQAAEQLSGSMQQLAGSQQQLLVAVQGSHKADVAVAGKVAAAAASVGEQVAGAWQVAGG